MPKQKLYDVTKENAKDGVYETNQQDGADEFGKRKITPGSKRKIVSKAGGIKKEDGGVGTPDAPSSVEDQAFSAAYSRIDQLKKDKTGKQDF